MCCSLIFKCLTLDTLNGGTHPKAQNFIHFFAEQSTTWWVGPVISLIQYNTIWNKLDFNICLIENFHCLHQKGEINVTISPLDFWQGKSFNLPSQSFYHQTFLFSSLYVFVSNITHFNHTKYYSLTQGKEEFNAATGPAMGCHRKGGGLSHPPAMSSMARVKTTHLGVVTHHLQLWLWGMSEEIYKCVLNCSWFEFAEIKSLITFIKSKLIC